MFELSVKFLHVYLVGHVGMAVVSQGGEVAITVVAGEVANPG